jgi:hypothetical protein
MLSRSAAGIRGSTLVRKNAKNLYLPKKYIYVSCTEAELWPGTDPEILASGVKIYDKYLLNKLISNKIISLF